jgi:hypothetical protein
MVQRRPDRKRLRRQMAEEMAAERAQRSTEHQWDHLDQRLGKDHGACRERARLFIRQTLDEEAREILEELKGDS